ncbi:hypothetical protein quinque_001370 [Culex quinquefasciatus]
MKSDSDSDLDMDVSIDINKVGTTQAHEMNACGRHYGMKSNDFYSYLTKDSDEAEALRMAREEEQEKIMFSGRKSRRERRAQRERKFAGRPLSPPSYAAKEELVPRTYDDPNDSSRSPSPVNSGKITYITSFGGEDELQPHSKISISFNKDSQGGAGSSRGGASTSYAEKVKQNLEKLKSISTKEEENKMPAQYQRRSRSYSDRSRSVPPKVTLGYIEVQVAIAWLSRQSKIAGLFVASPKDSIVLFPIFIPTRSRSPPRNKPTIKTEPPERAPAAVPPPPSISQQPPPVPPPAPAIVVKKEEKPPVLPVEPEPDVPVRRYYGRKRDGQSSSEDDITSDSSGDESSKPAAATEPSHSIAPPPRELGGYLPTPFSIKQEKLESSSSRFGGSEPAATATVGGPSSVTPDSKVIKADKKAEIEKVERQIQLQQEREDEMRELALRLRRRQRELRHKYGTPESDKSRSKSPANNSSDDDAPSTKEVSPPPKPPPQAPSSSSSSYQHQPSSSGSYGSASAVVIERKPMLRRVGGHTESSRSPSQVRGVRRPHSRSRSVDGRRNRHRTMTDPGDDRHCRRRRPLPGNDTVPGRDHASETGAGVTAVVEVVRRGIMTGAGTVAGGDIIGVGRDRGRADRGPSHEAKPVPVVPIAGTDRLK